MIVTIDGPAGSGKSTAARELARRLDFRFLDTGAMYRAVALACLRSHVDLSDGDRVSEIAAGVVIAFRQDRVLIDEVDVTDEIRSTEVTNAASVVALVPGVREALAKLQRETAAGENIITEGRDQGTHVFPDARCKFFLNADDEVRASRRQSDLQKKGEHVTQSEMLAQLRERDERDQSRALAPLKPAVDAVVIDTSELSVEEMLDKMEQIVRDRLASA